MKWSLKLGSVSGIAIFVHWTFLLLIVFIAAVHVDWSEPLEGQWGAVGLGVGFVLALFACVLLHELGHALTAKRVGVRTRDIVLLPIGGLARMERMPDRPAHELLIAAAGPAVNVVIAAGLFLGLVLLGADARPPLTLMEGNFWARLMTANIILVVFNMLPAFPMDGGRILRALLAMRLDFVTATEVAARTGQAMAIVFGLLGLLSANVILMLIAVFVFLGAEAESQSAKLRHSFRGLRVADAMMTNFVALAEDDTLDDAVGELLAGSQQDFPVLSGGRVAGLLRRSELLGALRDGGLEARVGEAMRRDCPLVAVNDPLDGVYERMQESGCSALPVVDAGRLVGLISTENVGELVMVRSALQDARGYRKTG